jgi:ZIP family zinc transporter/zinc and cadmium transporter
VISKYYFHVCPACSASHFDEQTTKRFSEIVLLLFTALSFHSFLDGLALSTSGVSEHGKANSILLAVLAHKFPEGLALASLMVGANYTKGKILKYVFFVESATVLGALIGDLFLAKYFSMYWLAFVEAHIAGGFVYLSFHAVFGELLRNHKALVIVSFLAGLLIIFGVSLI